MQLAAPITHREAAELVHMHGSPILVLDGKALERQYMLLSAALPGVRLFYAVKALPSYEVVKILDKLGCCFDLASTGEVEFLSRCGVSAERAIYTHPVKKPWDIEKAIDYGCRLFVIDNPVEIEKIRPYRDKVSLLVRAGFSSADAVIDLARKFGAAPEDVPELAQMATRYGIDVAGICFHVGSQSICPDAHARAVLKSAELITRCRAYGINMRLLDIGGGFPVQYADKELPESEIDAFCRPVRDALVSLPEDVQVLAEPGRFVVAPAVTAISSVVGVARRGGMNWYYIDDGVYGSYSGMIFDHARYRLEALGRQGRLYPSVLAGPTCDSIDIVAEEIMLPKLEVGDLIAGYMIGAYAASTATDFNMLPRAKLVLPQ